MFDIDMDYEENPRLRITKKGVELLTLANDSIQSIADDLVFSSVLLDTHKPVMMVRDGKSIHGIGPKTKAAVEALENSLFTMEALAALEEDEEGMPLLLYPDSVKEALTSAIPFLVEGIAEMKQAMDWYDQVIEDAEPESGEGYVEGYIAMQLEEKIKEFEEAILALKKALDIFI
ncbi:hypothetical protein [Bacillus sp. ISL-37]|uniref:hypothetical protein n=1 Tax=Bacillus sp. ISL-37 TaxID=2819123 RepID=UPI001BE6B82B|nr:hypothetical protein [Bacillus sp. ISL-37]MBT2686416.1 hypothetical protein [Bacillus sp. ISL-37]